MLDYEQHENVYVTGLDPQDPTKVVECLYVGHNMSDGKPNGKASVRISNGSHVVVPTKNIYKSSTDAKNAASRH